MTSPAIGSAGASSFDRLRMRAMFNRLKDFRRIATRYDKLACNDASALALAAIIAFWRSWSPDPIRCITM